VAKPSNIVFRAYQRTLHSLAFYPSLIALGFLVLCLLSISLEYHPWVMALKAWLEVGLVRDADNARLILGTVVAGIISLMVFSFSMVMVVLNNASSSLSPRLIPGLVSSKSHQKTLGVYVGTILYAWLLTTTIEQGSEDRVPSLGVLIALVLGLACLGLFVYFIRSISQSIQVEHILTSIFLTTEHKLAAQTDKLASCPDSLDWPDDQHWPVTCSARNGYFKELNSSLLNQLLSKHQLRMTLQVHRGFFVMAGHPLFKLDREVEDPICQELLDCFDFFIEEYVGSHYFFGCKQISEIAVKALSPGINDPGTAIKAIDLLSVLLAQRQALPDWDVAPLHDQPPRLFYHELPFTQLLLLIYGPIRSYAAGDAQVLCALLQAFKTLLHRASRSDLQLELLRHTRSVLEAADRSLLERIDRDAINAQVMRINGIDAGPSPRLEPLQLIAEQCPGRTNKVQ
jgi:uncharacterized membrane protein